MRRADGSPARAGTRSTNGACRRAELRGGAYTSHVVPTRDEAGARLQNRIRRSRGGDGGKGGTWSSGRPGWLEQSPVTHHDATGSTSWMILGAWLAWTGLSGPAELVVRQDHAARIVQ